MARDLSPSRNGFVHSARVVAAFALGGAVVFGLARGWIPAFAALDMHAIGAAIGAITGVASQTHHYA